MAVCSEPHGPSSVKAVPPALRQADRPRRLRASSFSPSCCWSAVKIKYRPHRPAAGSRRCLLAENSGWCPAPTPNENRTCPSNLSYPLQAFQSVLRKEISPTSAISTPTAFSTPLPNSRSVAIAGTLCHRQLLSAPVSRPPVQISASASTPCEAPVESDRPAGAAGAVGLACEI